MCLMVSNKITELKKQKGLTNAKLAELSGVPLGTISKIASGQTKDPQLGALSSIAAALGCSIEDLIEDGTVQSKKDNYYVSDEVSKMAQEIYDNPELRILFDASRKLNKDDVLAVVDIVKRMKGYYE